MPRRVKEWEIFKETNYRSGLIQSLSSPIYLAVSGYPNPPKTLPDHYEAYHARHVECVEIKKSTYFSSLQDIFYKQLYGYILPTNRCTICKQYCTKKVQFQLDLLNGKRLGY